MSCEHFRFVERHRPFRDLTFKFYDDGRLTIIDNESESIVTPNDLRGDSRDFYVRKRIAFIKKDLQSKVQKYA
ncbi:hypothetical protein ACLBWT_19380 [Paenibacillus sp. D51F]|uniref:hypothetical protein n=1 Tax=unclassified Paenibacillus TaxID=185978 RepID=UPI000956BCE9|nr:MULTISPECIES: hypothetical protein [unclassified Paenibacillus]ASS65309.1 hypothetical protein CIC07_03635 [Paenibacillus sp. RUD330]SIQ40366.1 hypothetical protein SAMN05880555_1637 [Paenibacillus sp. RU4X]SIQ62540.1 hypothetical protein SAMN05880570_1635 [Paenibacillus sp. RU4T]